LTQLCMKIGDRRLCLVAGFLLGTSLHNWNCSVRQKLYGSYLAGDRGRGCLSSSGMAISWTLDSMLPQIGAIIALTLALALNSVISLTLALALISVISRYQGLLKLRQFTISLLEKKRISSSTNMPKVP